MTKVDVNELGMTEDQLIEKYGELTTKQILNSRVFNGATVALNEKNIPVYYWIDIEHALREIKGLKTTYFD